MDERYISKQISVYKTGKNLCELLNKLNLPPLENYARLHAKGDKSMGGDWKLYSNIGIVLQDYSAGTGDKTVRVTANISPEAVLYIFMKLNQGDRNYKFEESKVFGNADANGFSIVTKLIIERAEEFKNTKTGEITLRSHPWRVYIENGKGTKEITKTGGTVYKNYRCEKKVQVAMKDYDFYCLFCKAVRFIEVWEMSNCPKLLRDAELEIGRLQAEKNRKNLT